MTTSYNVKLFFGAVLVASFTFAATQDTSTTPMATMAMNSDTTAASMTPMDTSTEACNEEEMQKMRDCCKPFMPLPPGDVIGMVRKAIDSENSRSNSTVWTLDSITEAWKKDCMPTIFKIQAHLIRTAATETNGTKTECRMKFRRHMLTREESEDNQRNKQELIIDEFCNGTSALSALYTMTMTALLVALLRSRFF
ncbi:uncharacterized protein LOC100905575 [Galendromus occidentalis]|uniref:Uncharacterized protein LOC100905575 n=1 Tax=Galendromus occidentalis TaxID=34638 RepID=A0AAJ6QS54_9ACAR|nr:uncharacterized protein LOC100905575 [Galendromus occidentalis]